MRQNVSVGAETFHAPRRAAFHPLVLWPAVNRAVIHLSVHSLQKSEREKKSAIQGCGVTPSGE